jgi:transposase-like protein
MRRTSRSRGAEYLYRAVDKQRKTVDSLLTAERDMAAAKRFFDKGNESEP